MKIMNLKHPVKASWLREIAYRMDARPFISGAMEAKKTLQSLSAKKDELHSLTAGYQGGIYNGPQFTRNYVDDAQHGVRFMTSGGMLLGDLSTLPFLSAKDAKSPKLAHLEIQPGMTLISCSGTIGRTVFARPEMSGVWSSQDMIKVVPDESKVPAGYIFAFLSSKYGLPIVTASTYGSIIPHLEPEHIQSLPVPRFSRRLETQVDGLIQEAAERRTRAAEMIDLAVLETTRLLGLGEMPHHDVSKYGISSVNSEALNSRFDAFYHSEIAGIANAQLHNANCEVELLSSVTSRLFKPPIFKRLWVESSNYGRQFVSGSDAYRYAAEQIRFVSRKTPNFDEFILKRGWLVFQAAGQVYGLFGRPLLVCGWLEEIFCADDVYRVVPKTIEDGAFLFAFFKTPQGEVLLKRQACGNSIPRIWDPHMAQVEVPWPNKNVREHIAMPIIEAHDSIELARIAEKNAIEMVESAIEENA